MSTALAEHRVQWVTAAPLWDGLVPPVPSPGEAARRRMREPALLRFASDDFMAELEALLADDPAGLAAHRATPQSYRSGPPGMPASWAPRLDRLKLYQAAHGHFTLVAATLVCRLPGLPDRGVDVAGGDRTAFVLRRLAPGGGELAWVPDPAGPQGRGWAAVGGDGATVARDEELLPLFPLHFDAGGRRRRLLLGLVPTTSRESFAGGPVSLVPPQGAAAPDPRLIEFDAAVVGGLAAVKEDPLAGLTESTVPRRSALEPSVTAAKRAASRFLLLDMADLVHRCVPDLRAALTTGAAPPPGPAQALWALLGGQATPSITWRDAMRTAWAERERIWGEAGPAPSLDVDLSAHTLDVAGLRDRFAAALGPAPAPAPGAEAAGPDAPKLDPREDTRYVVRCVLRRPACGLLQPDVVSEPSEDFAIASFFDSDAPARRVQITMPLDPSIAALRRSPKNVTFLLSKELRNQMQRAGDLKNLMKGQLAEGQELDVGMLCSFSLPIITICALLLLIIVVGLLNIVFWWLPFFRICLPIPLRKGGS